MRRAVYSGLLLLSTLVSPSAMAAWDGVIDWAQRTELSTATSGVVEKVLVSPGQHVDKGDSLLQLEPSALQAGVAKGKAAMSHYKLMLEEAERELERTEELYARTLLADRDLNLATIDHAKADAVYQQSRAEYLEALERLRNSRIRAPFDALVLERRVEPGQTVVSRLRTEPQLIVAAAGKRLVRFSVNADELDKLPPGTPVVVEAAGSRHEGRVEGQLLSQAKDGEPVVVEAIFDADKRLLPGLRAKVLLP
ncbi:MAG: efflux RND transporter periplasmic adaptor subunit [Pseudomonadota bacterium]